MLVPATSVGGEYATDSYAVVSTYRNASSDVFKFIKCGNTVMIRTPGFLKNIARRGYEVVCTGIDSKYLPPENIAVTLPIVNSDSGAFLFSLKLIISTTGTISTYLYAPTGTTGATILIDGTVTIGVQ